MALEQLTSEQHRLADRGFRAQLVADDDQLRDRARDTTYDPAEVRAVEIVRFEGPSDPADESVMVAIATRDGVPIGTFVAPYGPAATEEQAGVLRRLHRVVATPEDVAEHDVHDHVAAAMPDRAAAAAAVEQLRDVGLGSEHMGIALKAGDDIVFEHDEEAEFMHDLGTGIASGAAVGVTAGMLLFGIAVPGIGTLGVGGLIALGVASGIDGGLIGAYTTSITASEKLESHGDLRHAQLEEGEVLLVACGHHHRDAVERAMTANGGRLIDAAA